MASEWVRYSTLRYITHIAECERSIEAGIEYKKQLEAQLDGVGAVRYDHDGSRAGWTDHLPEAIDKLTEITERLCTNIVAWSEEVAIAHSIFSRYDETAIAWDKWGKKRTWSKVARMHGFSEGGARKCAERGLDIIYAMMPEEYRRSPYPAQPWENRGSF